MQMLQPFIFLSWIEKQWILVEKGAFSNNYVGRRANKNEVLKGYYLNAAFPSMLNADGRSLL
jgi:hypothetical protein